MDQRTGDARVYVVWVLFFSCIISGGVFLCLYIVLPVTQSSRWFAMAGMVLVSIPWAFWFFTFFYQCFKPHQIPPQCDTSKAPEPITATTTPTPPNLSTSESPVAHSPATASPAERRVQFGPVVVLGGQSEGNAATQKDQCDHHHHQVDNANEVSNCSSESEMPLRLSV